MKTLWDKLKKENMEMLLSEKSNRPSAVMAITEVLQSKTSIYSLTIRESIDIILFCANSSVGYLMDFSMLNKIFEEN